MLSNRNHGTSYISKREIRFANEEGADVQLFETAYITRPSGFSDLLLLQSALQPLDGFWPAQLSLSILSRSVLESAVASGMSNPQLGGEPGI
jgi:hypothetical protein